MMSGVILIIGILMSVALSFYRLNNTKQRVGETRARLERINNALKSYLLKNGYFPCPAPLNCNADDCDNSSLSLGVENRSDGNCISDSNSGVFASGTNLYGNVPALSLGISNENLIDAWGNKIVYMVPETLTRDGALENLSENKRNGIVPEYIDNGKLYILMSFGKNTSGAYGYNSKSHNYFSGKENMPTSNFTVETEDSNMIFLTQNFRNFEMGNLENQLQECPELILQETLKVRQSAFNDNKDDEENCKTFVYSGSIKTFTVPENVSLLRLEVWGAEGGSTRQDGGRGGYSYGELNVSPGDKLKVILGEKGEDGTTTGGSGGGGGSAILMDNRLLIVAGGGGGSGSGSENTPAGRGGGGANAGGGFTQGGGGGGKDGKGGRAGSNTTCVAKRGSTRGGGGGCNAENGESSTTGYSSGGDAANSNSGKGGKGYGGGGGGGSNGSMGGGGGGGGYGGGGAGSNTFGAGGGGGYIGGVSNGGGWLGYNTGNGKAKICYIEDDATNNDEDICIDFSYTGGEQSFTVPSGVNKVHLEVYGAAGGRAYSKYGGNGGYSYGDLDVVPGDILYINVGGKGQDGRGGDYSSKNGGYNGGGDSLGGAGGGGGATDIRYNGTALSNRAIVAGGGGGGSDAEGGKGGGGNAACTDGSVYSRSPSSPAKWGVNSDGIASNASDSEEYGCGGGGGGYYGGDAGTAYNGGGGGSGYIGGVSNGGGASGKNSGNGKAKICYQPSKLEDNSPYYDEDGCINFQHTGSDQTFKIPDNVNLIRIEAWGAEGGGITSEVGRKGGYSYGEVNVNPGDSLKIVVGGRGENGTIDGGGGGGGGTAVFLEDKLLIVSGGGGGSGSGHNGGGYGGGGGSRGYGFTIGGGGGGDNGEGGRAGSNDTCVAKKGLTRGGGGSCSAENGGNSTTGYSSGGAAANSLSGAGGGGYGGGGAGSYSYAAGGGGSYVGAVSNAGGSVGVNSGDGRVRICHDIEKEITLTYTFPKSKYGEVVFSKEPCFNYVSYPAKSGDFYYLSEYEDSSGNIIYNKPAKRCGKNGQWEDGFVYECKEADKCTRPSYGTYNFSNFDFEVVNTGIVRDLNNDIEMMCIIKDDEAKWYLIN